MTCCYPLQVYLFCEQCHTPKYRGTGDTKKETMKKSYNVKKCQFNTLIKLLLNVVTI